jgi:hypothetical protein
LNSYTVADLPEDWDWELEPEAEAFEFDLAEEIPEATLERARLFGSRLASSAVARGLLGLRMPWVGFTVYQDGQRVVDSSAWSTGVAKVREAVDAGFREAVPNVWPATLLDEAEGEAAEGRVRAELLARLLRMLGVSEVDPDELAGGQIPERYLLQIWAIPEPAGWDDDRRPGVAGLDVVSDHRLSWNRDVKYTLPASGLAQVLPPANPAVGPWPTIDILKWLRGHAAAATSDDALRARQPKPGERLEFEVVVGARGDREVLEGLGQRLAGVLNRGLNLGLTRWAERQQAQPPVAFVKSSVEVLADVGDDWIRLRYNGRQRVPQATLRDAAPDRRAAGVDGLRR